MDTVKARKSMVDSQVRPNDVPDIHLQVAMETVPREIFVPANKRALAYVEMDVPLFDGRWLLKARDFSKLIHAAKIKPTDLVLDVGCGYGYSAAIMAHLASVVVGVEANAEAIEKAEQVLADLALDNVAMVQGDLPAGVPSQGPFDVIVVAGGVTTGLEPLLQQLRPDGGRLVTIIVKKGVGVATLITRSGDSFGHLPLFEAHPSGILPGFEAPATFQF
ncbi:protein-L-isoaspartate O-methyltransferase [Parvularcula sp. LCG005]|uniref:protein-L-isoaspartate O-methyltransferase family protein n=1 Tax=Parvularcula sp. LCG005 TaxID=3078805 RepID=UPI00294370A4|nr:protein-L-isoaspartate O-methyltransferase [Parvularcula sp. LCG005]WOI52385.1 protein-L-isoaspartate O-methyltransferase [Parvularcula sp. LCG005]